MCKTLYEKDYQEILSQCRDIVKSYETILQLGMVDVLGGDKDEDIQRGFHKLTRNQMLAHVLHNEVRKAAECELDEDEQILFADQSVDFVKKMRYIISNLDKVTTKGRGNKMPSLTIAFLFERYRVESKNELAFYKYLKGKYSGNYDIPSYQAVNKAKNKCYKLNEDEQGMKQDLNDKIDGLLTSYVSSNKGKTSQMPISSNGMFV